jgi:hypothetical protein
MTINETGTWAQMLKESQKGSYQFAIDHGITKHHVLQTTPNLFRDLCHNGLTKSVQIMCHALSYTDADIPNWLINECRDRGHLYLSLWLKRYRSVMAEIREVIQKDKIGSDVPDDEVVLDIRDEILVPSTSHEPSDVDEELQKALMLSIVEETQKTHEVVVPLIDQAYTLVKGHAEEIKKEYLSNLEEQIIDTLRTEINVYLGAISGRDRDKSWGKSTFPKTYNRPFPTTRAEFGDLVRFFVMNAESLMSQPIYADGGLLCDFPNIQHVIDVLASELTVTYR